MDAYSAAAIQAVGSIGSSIASGRHASAENRKAREFNEKMYYQQLEDNRENWRMMNEYNLPSAVRQRYEDAGLNPLLLYPEGAANGMATLANGSTSQGSPAGHAQFNNPLGDFTSSVTAMKKLDTEIDLMKAQEMKTINEGLAASAQFVKSHAESENIKSQTEYNIRSMEDRLALNTAERRLKDLMSTTEEWKVAEIQKTIEKTDADIDFVGNMIYNNTRMTDQQIEESANRIKNANKETAQRIATMKAEERKAYADAWLARENARTAHDVHDDLVEKYHQDMRKAILDGNAQEIENAMNDYTLKMMPKQGSASWKWQRFFNNWVTPVTSSFGAILGGAVAGVGAAAVRKK